MVPLWRNWGKLMVLANGTILRNRYQIIKYLGGGGCGETYLAYDLNIPINPKLKCVVKRLLPQNIQPVVLRLFEKEAATLYKLNHTQIPKFTERFQETVARGGILGFFASQQSEYYLIQEYVQGYDLSWEIIPNQQLQENDVIHLLRDLLNILAYVHQNGIIHRDIKPQNIMRRQSDGKLVLIDFGIVKEMGSVVVNQGQTTYTISAGTPGYMPAEQGLGKPTYSSDIYAVGVMAIFALTGISPNNLTQDKNLEIYWRKHASVSYNLADILDKMVRYDCRQRYGNAAEALTAIQSLPYFPPPPGWWEEQRKYLEEIKRQQEEAATPPIVSIQRAAELKRLEEAKRLEEQKRLEEAKRREEELKRREAELKQREAELKRQEETKRLEEQKLLEELRRREEELKRRLATRVPPQPPTLPTFQFTTFTVNATGQVTNRTNKEAKYYRQNLDNGVFIDMVAIPGGKFQMGTPDSEPNRYDNESPQHQVTVSSFYLAKYPITQAQYQAIMGQNPSHFKGSDLPVEQVTWNNAVEFCQKLAQKTGQAYRLPSEAEWEYACRAGTTTPFYFGDTITTDLANYNGDYTYGNGPKGQYRQKTTPVGSFPPNAFGLYDMHGNVWEWCQDVWHDNYDKAPTDGTAWETGGNSSYRVQRGGSWYGFPRGCRSGQRRRNDWVNRNFNFGFRVAVSLLPSPGL